MVFPLGKMAWPLRQNRSNSPTSNNSPLPLWFSNAQTPRGLYVVPVCDWHHRHQYRASPCRQSPCVGYFNVVSQSKSLCLGAIHRPLAVLHHRILPPPRCGYRVVFRGQVLWRTGTAMDREPGGRNAPHLSMDRSRHRARRMARRVAHARFKHRVPACWPPGHGTQEVLHLHRHGRGDSPHHSLVRRQRL